MTRFGRSAMISTPTSVIAAPTIMCRSSRSPSSNTPSTTVKTGDIRITASSKAIFAWIPSLGASRASRSMSVKRPCRTPEIATHLPESGHYVVRLWRPIWVDAVEKVLDDGHEH